MNAFLKILAALFLVIWTLLGSLLLVGAAGTAFFIASGEPQRIANSVLGTEETGSSNGGLQGLNAEEIQRCVTQTLGTKRSAELFAGNEPTQAEVTRLLASCGSLMGGMIPGR